MILASLIQPGKDITIPWISKVATRGLFHFRNQLQSFTIRLHSSNRNLYSAWAVIRFQFYKVLLRVQHGISFLRANFAIRTLYTALSKYCRSNLDYSDSLGLDEIVQITEGPDNQEYDYWWGTKMFFISYDASELFESETNSPLLHFSTL